MSNESLVSRGYAVHPHKNTSYRFPRDGARYSDKVSRMANAEPCEHGHFGCALWHGGPCADEAAHSTDSTQQPEDA